jgi:YD repeat-containing protein
MTTPTGQAEVWEYDQRGLKTKIIRADGSCLQLEYDSFDNPIGFIDPLGRKTTFEYDKYGYKLLSITSPGGRTTRFNLDGNGRLLEEIFADGSSTYPYL